MRYENEIEFDGVAYMLMCEIELVEREHKAVSMMCGIEPQYTDMPVRIIGNMGKAIGEILPVLNNFWIVTVLYMYDINRGVIRKVWRGIRRILSGYMTRVYLSD